jgi:hypothetical protein
MRIEKDTPSSHRDIYLDIFNVNIYIYLDS